MEENWDEPSLGGAATASSDANNNEAKPTGFGFGFGNRNKDNNQENEGGGFGGGRGGRGGFGGGRGGGRGGFNRNEDGENKEGGGFRKFGNRDENGGGGFQKREGGFRNREENNGDGEKRSFGERRGGGFGGRGGGEGGERRSFGNREGGEGGERRGFGNRDGGEGGERRSFGNRDGGEGGERRGFGNRDGGEGGERRGFGNRDGGEGGERRGFGNREGGERRSFGNRDGGEGGEGGERKGFGNRDGGEGGERRGFGNREGGERRSFGNRDGGEGGEKKSFGNRDRGERKSFGDAEAGDEKKTEKYIPADEVDTEESIFHSFAVGVNFKKQTEIPVSFTGDGSENIKPIENFKDAKLTELILENVKKCNYEIPTPVQKYAIPIIEAKRDLMACAQTGSGKTAAYVLPIMTNILSDGIESSSLSDVQQPQALILSPTRELALQIYNECKKFSYGSILKSAILYGGVDTGYQLKKLFQGCNILVATPGRLLGVMEMGKINLEKVKYFVLDEADRMLDMGFEKDVRKILEKGQIQQKGERCTLMFSATFPEPIQKLAQDFLNNYLFIAVGVVGGANTDVEQTIHKVTKFEKRNKLVEILTEIGNDRTMIFLEHKKQADILAFFLIQKQFPTTSIHGDRLQSQRETALKDFRLGTSRIIVCTSVAARGLDIEKVQHVINYDLPQSIDEYVHRIGRTGRCGNLGKAISFFDPESENDVKLARPLVRTLTQAKQEIPEWLNSFAEDSVGTAFGGSACTDDLRDKFQGLNVAAAAKTGSAATGEDEVWD